MKEYISKNPFSARMLNLFSGEDSADIVFEIYEQQQTKASRRKRAKTSSAKVHAHRFILQLTRQSSPLFALHPKEWPLQSLMMSNLRCFDIFSITYIYGGEIDGDHFATHAKDLINASDKYGVTNLKLEAEVWYVHSTQITIENVIDNLLYADAMNWEVGFDDKELHTPVLLRVTALVYHIY